MKDYSVWHPYTQMKRAHPLVQITHGKGVYLFDREGKKYIDAISSWWTNVHGHCHRHIVSRITSQVKKLDHVIFAGYNHPAAVELAERLLDILPGNQKKVFYSDNGSTSVEVALKMALQFHYNGGKVRNKIIAFRHGYHGDTFGSMSVSERGIFSKPFSHMLFPAAFIDVPVKGKEGVALRQLAGLIKRYQNRIAAFIFEPLVLGAGGMIMYEPKPLEDLIVLCKRHGIITIADEVMTGFGRTGMFFGCDHLSVKPDIFCLSKGLTGGTLPLGVTATTGEIYSAFLSDNPRKTFFHGHSFTANPVSCAAALASLELFKKKVTWKNINRISEKHLAFSAELNVRTDIRNVRTRGTILAFDLKTNRAPGYLDPVKERAIRFFQERGIVIRPLGNVFYLMPPFCISNDDLDYIYHCIIEFLEKVITQIKKV